jgi:tetratricopeptide (TPR) repeat protein
MHEDFADRAKVLITQRRYEDALRLCRLGLSTDASRGAPAEGHRVLGMALLALRRFDDVRAEMMALLRARPDDVVARRLLGQALLQAGDPVRARDELETARRLAPEDPRIAALIDELADPIAEVDPPTDITAPPPMRPRGPPTPPAISSTWPDETTPSVTPVMPTVARAAALRMSPVPAPAVVRPPSEPPPLPTPRAPVPTPSLSIDALDEPLSADDFSAPRPPMTVPPDRLRSLPRLESALHPAPPADPPPARPLAAEATGPMLQRAQGLPRYALPAALALALALVLTLVGVVRWRVETRRVRQLEGAEIDEALGDYPSLRTAVARYRELSDEEPGARAPLARLARAHAFLAFELGAPDDEREARSILERLRGAGDGDGVSAQIEATARAYLLAVQRRPDEAQRTLRTLSSKDPHVAFLRARLALQAEAYEEASRVLRASTPFAPSWVRLSTAFVEVMSGLDPRGAAWRTRLEQLAARYPQHVGVRLLRARFLAGRPESREEARRELQALAQPALWSAASPGERAWVHLLDAVLSAQTHDGVDQATRALASVRALPPVHDVQFRLLVARVLLDLRQRTEAKAELAGLVDGAPPRARSEARLLLAEAHLALGELSLADARLAQVDESPRRHLLQGRLLMAQRRTAEALVEFGVAKTQDPSLALVVDLEGARAQLDIRETSSALQTLRALARDRPGDLEITLLLGDALRQAGDLTEAEAVYRGALGLAEGGIEARLRLARLARGRGDVAGARAMLAEIAARDGDNLQAEILAASLAGESGDLPEALRILARLQGLPGAPDVSGAVAVLRAELSLRAGTFEEVATLLERGQRAGAEVGDHQHVLGLYKLRTYDIPGALSALRRATDAASGNGVRRAELARAYLLSAAPGRDAEQNAEDALRIDPRLADALAVRALVVMDSPNIGAAAPLLRAAEEALQTRPRDANVQAYVSMARGRYHYEQGRPRDARTLLDQALRLDGKLAEAHYFLGLALIDLASPGEACTELARFLELAPAVRDSADAELVRRRLGCR